MSTAAEVTFWLGTGNPAWLATAGVPLFVSDTRLRGRVRLPRAVAPWGLDSGGFTQLQRYGTWTVPPREYVARVRRYRDEIGQLTFCAPQDWMAEHAIRHGGWHGGQFFVGTHRPVTEHLWRTVLNWLHLADLAPDLPIIPVVQGGDDPDDYVRCADLYWTLGRVDLTTVPLVGVGSVCRRQGSTALGRIFTALHARGLTRLHAFGVKTLGLTRYGHLVTSADSQAWSRDARHQQRPVCGQPHPRNAKNCANCLPYALAWRARLLTGLAAQPSLFDRDTEDAA